MKEFIKKNKVLLLIILSIIIILIFLIIFLNLNRDKSGNNSYSFSQDVIELPNTVTYKNEKLSASHCLDGICINEATFYYNDDMGRVEYTITNLSKKTKSGYLKMVFNDQKLIVVYKNLEPNKSIKSRSQYTGMEINDKSDYVLEKLTDKELKNMK